MSGRLTKKAIDTAPVSDREAYLWDGELRGFGLRIRPSGARSFVYIYRPGGGRAAPKRKVTIGTYGTITLEQARAKARRLAGDVAHSRDPALEIRANREARSVATKTTVSVLVPLFVEQHHRARGNRSADEAGRTLSFDLAKRWPHRSVKEITGPELTRLLRDVAVGRKAPGQARRLYIALSRFFRWCVAEGYCASSPVSTVEAPPPDRVRERVISDLEIALMWRSAQTLGYPFGYCIQLLILTGRVETKSLKRNAPNSISRPRHGPFRPCGRKTSAPTFVIYHLRRSPSSRPCRSRRYGSATSRSADRPRRTRCSRRWRSALLDDGAHADQRLQQGPQSPTGVDGRGGKAARLAAPR